MNTIKFVIDPNDLYEFTVKKHAKALVQKAVNDGVLVRPYHCQLCTIRSDKIQAHHTDYGEPLKVNWVCPKCHANIHHTPKHKLNPVNIEQGIQPDVMRRLTYAKVEIDLPIENFFLLKTAAEELEITVEDAILRVLTHIHPSTIIRKQHDYTRKNSLKSISSLVENETKLFKQKLSGLRQSRCSRGRFSKRVDRLHSVS